MARKEWARMAGQMECHWEQAAGWDNNRGNLQVQSEWQFFLFFWFFSNRLFSKNSKTFSNFCSWWDNWDLASSKVLVVVAVVVWHTVSSVCRGTVGGICGGGSCFGWTQTLLPRFKAAWAQRQFFETDWLSLQNCMSADNVVFWA